MADFGKTQLATVTGNWENYMSALTSGRKPFTDPKIDEGMDFSQLMTHLGAFENNLKTIKNGGYRSRDPNINNQLQEAIQKADTFLAQFRSGEIPIAARLNLGPGVDAATLKASGFGDQFITNLTKAQEYQAANPLPVAPVRKLQKETLSFDQRQKNIQAGRDPNTPIPTMANSQTAQKTTTPQTPGTIVKQSANSSPSQSAKIAAANKVAASKSGQVTTQTSPKTYTGLAQDILNKLNASVDAGNQPLSATQRINLEKQFQSVTGETVPLTGGQPVRSAFPEGAKGDAAFQASVDKYNSTLRTKLGQNQSGSILNSASPDDANALLNNMGNAAFGDGSTATDGVPVRGGSNANSDLGAAEGFFTNILKGNTGAGATSGTGVPGTAPTFNAESKLAALRDQYDIDPLEKEVADIDEEIRAVQDTFTQNKFNEKGKAVALGVMAGRISEEEQQANDRLNQLNRNKAYKVDQLQTKYTTVNTIMNAAQMDYTNAKDLYDTQFNQKVTAMNSLLNIDQSQKTDEARARDDARANVSIVTNALGNGSLTWDNLDPATKTQYAKLEMQAGLPVGTISAFAMQAKGGQWEMSTVLPGVDESGNQIATILQKNKTTGEFKTTKLITDYSKGGSAKQDVVQQGTFTDASGNEIAWTKYADGTIEKSSLGKAKVSTADMSPDQKEENQFRKDVADLVGEADKRDSFGDPIEGAADTAVKKLRARYPWLTEQQARAELGL